MTISSKLATDFVKHNFNTFKFKNPLTKASAITNWNVYDAYIKVLCVDIELFCLDTDSTGCTMVKLPEKLCGKLGLEEALKLIDKEDMDMTNYCCDKCEYVRVTTNRLMMLEKLMKNSGFINPINPINHDMKDQIAAKIAQMQSEASSAYANVTKQLNELWEMINK